MDIELYEVLRPYVGDEGARLIAERVPPPENLATKDDVQAVKDDVQAVKDDVQAVKDDVQAVKDRVQTLEHRMDLGFAEIRRDFAEFKADMRGWMLRFFVPLWIGVYGTLGAMVISIVVRGG